MINLTKVKNDLVKFGITSLVLFILCSIFFFYNKKEIPLGILFGTIIIILDRFLSYLSDFINIKFKDSPYQVTLSFLNSFLRWSILFLSIFLCLFLMHKEIYIFSWLSFLTSYLVNKLVLNYKLVEGVLK